MFFFFFFFADCCLRTNKQGCIRLQLPTPHHAFAFGLGPTQKRRDIHNRAMGINFITSLPLPGWAKKIQWICPSCAFSLYMRKKKHQVHSKGWHDQCKKNALSPTPVPFPPIFFLFPRREDSSTYIQGQKKSLPKGQKKK